MIRIAILDLEKRGRGGKTDRPTAKDTNFSKKNEEHLGEGVLGFLSHVQHQQFNDIGGMVAVASNLKPACWVGLG
jgi:hypothetical protein